MTLREGALVVVARAIAHSRPGKIIHGPAGLGRVPTWLRPDVRLVPILLQKSVAGFCEQ